MADQTVIALGFFDGVHLGHGALLQTAVRRAREYGCASAAYTFDRAPKEFVTGTPVPLLSTAEERAALIHTLYGVDRVIVAQFDRAMMTLSWQDFLDRLVAHHGARHLVAGHDYRFGYRNEGTPAILQEYCAAHGLGCDVIPKVEREGITVSSTYIRSLVEAGELRRAADFLGHPYSLSGPVAHGRGLGSACLFPTANLAVPPGRILPRRGVYATRAHLADGRAFPGVTNVGVRPTVSDDGSVTVETHLVGFSGDLYGQLLRLDFLTFLREEEKFASPAALHDRIALDIEAAKRSEKNG